MVTVLPTLTEEDIRRRARLLASGAYDDVYPRRPESFYLQALRPQVDPDGEAAPAAETKETRR
jgi:hypothetical protein